MIGPNGAGKTTLSFRMIVGDEAPDGGTLRLGDSVELAYVDQSQARSSTPKASVWKEITGGMDRGDPRSAARRAPVARLRRLLQLRRAPTSRRRSPSCRVESETACTWRSCCEPAATCCCSTSRPTTSTSTRCARSRRRSSTSASCAVIISHDRWFLDRVATHIPGVRGRRLRALVRGHLRGVGAAPAPSSTATTRSGRSGLRTRAAPAGRMSAARASGVAALHADDVVVRYCQVRALDEREPRRGRRRHPGCSAPTARASRR